MNAASSLCLPHGGAEPAFVEPWHAQVFALTVHLNETGRFTWAEWVARFSATLKQHGLARELDGGTDYFNAWLETLEILLVETQGVRRTDVARMRDAWEEAYLATPHGAPVHLPKGL